MNDARGAVFQLIRSSDKAPIAINKDGTYKGNIVADIQIMVAKAIIDGVIQRTPQLQTVVNSLDETIIDWASSSDGVYEPKYRCNGDSMHHVTKGIAIIRVEEAVGFKIVQNTISGVTNLSPAPFDECYDYHKGANVHNAMDKASLQQGANIRGIAVAAVTGFDRNPSLIASNTVNNFISDNARVIAGIDIQGQSDSIVIRKNTVNLNSGGGQGSNDAFIAFRFEPCSLSQLDNNINIVSNNQFNETVQLFPVGRAIGRAVGGSGDCPLKKMHEWTLGGTPGRCPMGFKN